MIKPVLVFAYGNLSRGDDALGPLVLEHLRSQALPDVDMLCDFQLQIEHALDLEARELVVFVDASVACSGAFDFARLQPEKDKSYTTHAMSPASVLAVYESIKRAAPPPCFLLSIAAESFELGDGLSVNAEQNLKQACEFIDDLLTKPTLDTWLARVTDARNIAA